jgi:hypothetical protein
VLEDVVHECTQERVQGLRGWERRGAASLAERVHLAAVDRRGQRLPGGEVAVQGPDAHSRARGEVVEPQLLVVLEHRARRGDDRVAVAARVGPQRLVLGHAPSR